MADSGQSVSDSVIDRRKNYLRRWNALTSERSSWLDHWRELSQYIMPRTGEFLTTDRNKGSKKNNSIYDSTATRAVRVLAAGMMAGMTSPARPWFRLATPDKQLMKRQAVKVWCEDVSSVMRRVFAKSNTYRALHSQYEELGTYGTASDIIQPNFDNVIHHYPLTAGQYAVAVDPEGRVRTLYREFEMTVSQMVRQFGFDNCSIQVQNMFRNTGQLDAWRPVIHVIEPRYDRDINKKDAKNMAFGSIYFETGDSRSDKLLRESGYKRFPAVAPRWVTSGCDIYGSSPGMEALGDIKQLQHAQLRKAQGIDYKTKPPLQVPTSMKNRQVNTLPGGVTHVDSLGPHQGIRSAFETNLDLSHLLEDIHDVRNRINSTFYVDLFLMLQQQEGTMTAREVAERHEEKLLMLGPVLERLHDELLSPMIDLTFDRLAEAGVLPPPPLELQGMDLSVEFVSVLAQAQRAVGVQAVDRVLGTVVSLAGIKPEVVDKLNGDAIIDAYVDMLGVDPSLIVGDDKVALIREQRVKAQQAQQAVAAAQPVAGAMKDVAQANKDSNGGIQDLLSQFSGYTLPQGR